MLFSESQPYNFAPFLLSSEATTERLQKSLKHNIVGIAVSGADCRNADHCQQRNRPDFKDVGGGGRGIVRLFCSLRMSVAPSALSLSHIPSSQRGRVQGRVQGGSREGSRRGSRGESMRGPRGASRGGSRDGPGEGPGESPGMVHERVQGWSRGGSRGGSRGESREGPGMVDGRVQGSVQGRVQERIQGVTRADSCAETEVDSEVGPEYGPRDYPDLARLDLWKVSILERLSREWTLFLLG